jgi:hypothetical protein
VTAEIELSDEELVSAADELFRGYDAEEDGELPRLAE